MSGNQKRSIFAYAGNQWRGASNGGGCFAGTINMQKDWFEVGKDSQCPRSYGLRGGPRGGRGRGGGIIRIGVRRGVGAVGHK